MGAILGRRQNAASFVGVDISATHVKVLELTGKPGAIRVLGYAGESMPAHAVSDHEIMDVDAVGGAIARAVKRSGVRNRNAAISVAATTVINKTLSMPADMSDDDIEQQLLLEAPRHIPFPMENVGFDFQVLGPEPMDPSCNRVLLVACRRDNIEKRTAALKIAGLKPRLVDVDEHALRNACALLHAHMPDKGINRTVGVFDIGAHKTRFDVWRNRDMIYSQAEDFGGQQLADRLVEQLDLENEEQLSAWLREAPLASTDMERLLDDFCDQLAHQIKTALQFHQATETQPSSIEHMLLTGGCTRYPGFEARLRERLSGSLACANPLAGVRSNARARRNHAKHDGPALMLAAGLSMRTLM